MAASRRSQHTSHVGSMAITIFNVEQQACSTFQASSNSAEETLDLLGTICPKTYTASSKTILCSLWIRGQHVSGGRIILETHNTG